LFKIPNAFLVANSLYVGNGIAGAIHEDVLHQLLNGVGIVGDNTAGGQGIAVALRPVASSECKQYQNRPKANIRQPAHVIWVLDI
jgi:hypothetical protein